MKLSEKVKVFLGSGFYLGLLPLVPGSFGALTGLVWHLLAFAPGWSDMAVRLWCLWGAVIFSVMHYRLTPWAQKYWHSSDPKNFVLDEIVGYLFVPILCIRMTEWWQPLAGFCIFRIFDAIKLPVARYIDRNIHTASGVLFDDIVSAAYAAAFLSGIIWLTM